MKKIISVILSMLMLLPLFSMCLTAQAEDVPTVYVGGQGAVLFDSDAQEIYPLRNPNNPSEKLDWLAYLGLDEGVDISALITAVKNSIAGDKDALTPEEENSLFVQLLVSFLTESREEYANKFCEAIGPVYEKLRLNKDGNADDGSGLRIFGYFRKLNEFGGQYVGSYPETVFRTGGVEMPVDWFYYDWRCSPLEAAEGLRLFLLEKGYTRVNLIGRCLGANVVLAYLSKYGTDTTVNVEKTIFYMPSFMGINMLNTLFSGDIRLDSSAVTDFVTYFNNSGSFSLGDESTDNLLKAFLAISDSSAALPVGLDALELIIRNTTNTLLPKFLKLSYATFPAYWSMVGSDYYEQAKAFIYSDLTAEEKAEWAGLIAKTDAFYEIQKNYKSILKGLESNGTDIFVVAKYGLPCMPVSSDAHNESDLYQTTDRQSMGATVTHLDEKFSDEIIANNKYVSADGKIDASTCLFPDRTWFLKNCDHKQFPDCVNDMFYAMLTEDDFDINSDSRYTQYLDCTVTGNSDYSFGSMKPILKAEDTNDTTQTYDKSTITKLKDIFISLITKFINWVIGIFAGIKE